ncbi:alpha/beta hydrolase [Pseudohongiella spirulinae]|uniref:Xaa-Pro dipeptidyl-peptidase-like domain-containing protein n=1 Tax=Pseudohongiella spirulinae TaxID=1249552 RepID=A0A0S2KCA6_9GAMM|nr:alpha/beta fold hydrolase [Pseudohongiella spirulinae]ALO45942.1 hypothetical protein PS2015_1284 [Pseudohongiella spirulinae]
MNTAGKAIPMLFLISFLLSFSSIGSAQTSSTVPDNVQVRSADIWSEGTRLTATVYSPTSASAADRLPTILMAHGWGGVAAQLRRDAISFAQHGYLVVTFDYRGWGESDGRIIATEKLPGEHEGSFTVQVREIREIVDPVDMLADWENAMHWLQAEPQVDTDRIGVWGSSQSGGYVVEMAARDQRIKAVHSQVSSLSGRSIGETVQAYNEATLRARGELSYPQAGATVVGNLRGAPIANRFANYSPVDRMHEIEGTPIQFVLAGEEELFDNRDHGILAHDRYEGPKNLVVIPGISHYGIYREAWRQAHDLALAWFDRHLK